MKSNDPPPATDLLGVLTKIETQLDAQQKQRF
jgi:hypothetical protein